MKSSVKTAVNKEEQLSESRNTVMTTSGTFLQVATIIEECLTLRPVMSYIYIYIYIYIYMEHLFLMFLDHTQRRSTVGRTPLDE